MRIQTSIEFLIILAAVAGVSVAFIYAYEHAGNQVRSIYGYLNETQQGTTNAMVSSNKSTQVALYVYAPPASYMGGSSGLEVIVAFPPNSSAVSIIPTSQAFSFIPFNITSSNITSPYIAYFQAVPKEAGEKSINVLVKVIDNGNITYSKANASTYVYNANASSSPANTTKTITASILQSNDSVLYSLSTKNNLPRLSETSHCTYINFWYNPLSFENQCGNAAWDFSIFSDGCYDAGSTGRTYCVYEDPSGSYTRNVSASSGYTYNITLSLTYGNTTYTSNINSNEPHANLFDGAYVVGNVTITGQISGQSVQSPSTVEVLGSNSSTYPINMGYYNTYGQYLSSMEAKLGYYNGSGVNPTEFSSIQQSISSYNTYLSRFISTAADKACSIYIRNGTAYLSCPASSPLDFGNITVHIYNQTIGRSLYVGGSTINVK
ncbi:conserved hypothetical protein, membrane or secreted [mine drainage metagenome]|uniref:Uncharacterized protein n=1 Tax=mine drainage metagenome TaxID=410659 RepID=T1AV15_9ZZZZ